MARLAVLLLALSLVHSAQAQPVQPTPAAKARPAVKKPASPEGTLAPPSASGPCIGVFPLLGDRFQVKKIGITVFGNEFKEIAVDNWGLDDLVVERVRAVVGKGIAVRRIPHAKDAFVGYTPGIGIFQNNNAKVPAIVQQAAGQTHCQRYVVVTRAVAQYVGNQSIFGIGVVNSGRPIRSLTQIHAIIRIHVHDGKTFAVLKSGTGSLNGDNILTGGQNARALDDSWWPEPPEVANNPTMREAARSLLAEILDKSLPELLAR
jgi:hypothetical protein